MAISETENVSDHRHDCKRATVIAPAVEPCFRISTLEPEDPVKVLTCRVVERVLEHFELLHEAEMLKVGSHLSSELSAQLHRGGRPRGKLTCRMSRCSMLRRILRLSR